MFKSLHLFFLSLAMCSVGMAQQPLPLNSTWRANGAINAVQVDPSGNTAYLGGSFTYLGPYSGHGTIVNQATGISNTNFPIVYGGAITCAVPDGSGGWYIGGSFNYVAGKAVNRLAHILPNNTLDPNWTPNVSNTIWTMEMGTDGKLYIGGSFTTISINGAAAVTRNRLAAIVVATGQVDGWNPNISNGSVYAITLSQGRVYIGGTFTGTVAGTTRTRAAALTAGATATLLPWAPAFNSDVHKLVLSGDSLLACGSFTSITPSGGGATTRNRLASLDTTGTGTLKAWAPNCNSTVLDMELVGTTLYVGGSFTSFGTGLGRNRLAAFNITNGSLLSFHGNITNGSVEDILPLGNELVVCGSFTQINNVPGRDKLAIFNASDLSLTAFDAGINNAGTTYMVGSASGNLYVFGDGWSIGGVTRNRLAALDAGTGIPTAFNPGANSTVNDLLLEGNTLYVAGDFNGTTSLGDSARNYLGAIDLGTGKANALNLRPSARVRTMAKRGNILYIGGDFNGATGLAGQARNRLAAIDVSSRTVTAFNPNVTNRVHKLALIGDTLFVSGEFTGVASVAGANRTRLAAFNAANETLLAWDPQANGIARAFLRIGSKLYIGGEFSGTAAILTQRRDRFAQLEWSTLALTTRDYRFNGTIMDMMFYRNKIYTVGNFSTAGSLNRSGAAAIDTALWVATGWDPQIKGGTVNKIALMANNQLMLGGTQTYADKNGLRYYHYLNNTVYGVCNLTIDVQGTKDLCSGQTGTLLTAVVTGGDGNYNYRWSPYLNMNDPALQAPTFSNISASQVYTLLVDDNSGCDAIVMVPITVLTNVTPTISGINGSYCPNDAVVTPTLQPAGGTLSGPGVSNNTFDPATAPQNQQLTLTYSGGQGACSYSTTVNVTVTPGPDAFGLPVAPTCQPCTDGIIVLGANGGSGVYSYRLNSGTPQSSNTFRNLAAGTYNVTVSDGGNCPVTFSISVPEGVGPGPNARSSEATKLGIRLFPNPTSNSASLSLGSMPSATAVALQLTDITGRTVWTTTAYNNGLNSLPTQDLPAGMYYLHLMWDDHRASLPLLKQ